MGVPGRPWLRIFFLLQCIGCRWSRGHRFFCCNGAQSCKSPYRILVCCRCRPKESFRPLIWTLKAHRLACERKICYIRLRSQIKLDEFSIWLVDDFDHLSLRDNEVQFGGYERWIVRPHLYRTMSSCPCSDRNEYLLYMSVFNTYFDVKIISETATLAQIFTNKHE